MNRFLPTAVLALTASASIATSQAYESIEGQAELPPLDFTDGVVPATLVVETTGDVTLEDVTDLRVDLELTNPGDRSAKVSVYLLDAPYDAEVGLPEDVEPLGSLMVRRGLDGEEGWSSGQIHGGLEDPSVIHLALVSENSDVEGSALVTAAAFFSGDIPSGRVELSVVP